MKKKHNSCHPSHLNPIFIRILRGQLSLTNSLPNRRNISKLLTSIHHIKILIINIRQNVPKPNIRANKQANSKIGPNVSESSREGEPEAVFELDVSW